MTIPPETLAMSWVETKRGLLLILAGTVIVASFVGFELGSLPSPPLIITVQML